jgi:hypothetical protein
VSLPEASCNKLCISPDNKQLYAAGPRGTLQYGITNSSPPESAEAKFSSKPALVQNSGIYNSLNSITAIPSSPESLSQTVITQEPNTNDLVMTRINSEKKVEVGRIGGIYEPGKCIEHFHDYRGGDNTKYCTWKMGDDALAIVDKKEWQIKNKVSMFWTYGGEGKEWENRNPKSCMPVTSCVNK